MVTKKKTNIMCIHFKGVCAKLFAKLVQFALICYLITEKFKENYFMSW